MPSVASVDEAFAKFCSALHVLLFERSVEDAAVMVKVPPAVMAVVLIVARVPVRRLVPMELVETRSPFWSVDNKALVKEVNHTLLVAVNCDVDAFVKFCVAVHQLLLPRLRPQSLIAPLPSYDEPLSVASLVRAPSVPPRVMPEMALAVR